MKYVLVAKKIPKKLTLYESLLWVAFKAYFTEHRTRNLKERRLDPKTNFNVEFYNSMEVDMLFTEENCKKYGLPKNYETEIIESDLKGEEAELPYDNGISWEEIKELENNKKYEQEFIDYLKKEKVAFEKFSRKQEPFKNALKDYLEIPKAELLIQLKKGNIKSYGRKISNNFIVKDYIAESIAKKHNKSTKIEGEDFPDFSEIPIKYWALSKINWDVSILNVSDFKYCHIVLDTESLFKEFPEPKLQTTKVLTHNGTLLIDSINTSISPDETEQRGRKEKFNKKEINAEIIRRFMSGRTSKYQNAFIIEIQEWCEQKWGKDSVPSETYLKEFISPFYKVKKSQKLTS